MFLKELIVFILLIFLRQHLQVLQTKYLHLDPIVQFS